MVTHNTPINTHVFNAEHFFQKLPTRDYIFNECPYTYLEFNSVKYVDFNSMPKVQKTYI